MNCTKTEKFPQKRDSSENELLLFATHTCPNCALAVEALNKAGVPFTKVYADDEKDMARKYGVMSAPTLVQQNGDKRTYFRGASEIIGFVNENK